jgi:TolB-like protein
VNDRILVSSNGARRTKRVTHVRSISTSEIRAELERILSSGIFATADRMKRFLCFVVKETLDGRGDKLNEQQLGAEVYDRNERFDPRVDSIVRVDAGRLRSKLREFYVSEGRSSSIRIDIPKGSYKPSFKKLRDVDPSRSMQRFTREQAAMKTVAVLPFADLSPHGDQGHFGDGASEELAFALSRVRNLRVISQTSAFAFKGARTDVREIGRQLGVKFIVEGSVQKAKQKLRIMVRLADVATGYQIWSEVYTFGSRDVSSAQEEISKAVTMAWHFARGFGGRHFTTHRNAGLPNNCLQPLFQQRLSCE